MQFETPCNLITIKKRGRERRNEIKTETGDKPQNVPSRRTNSAYGEKILIRWQNQLFHGNAACGSFNATWLPDILYKIVHRCVEG